MKPGLSPTILGVFSVFFLLGCPSREARSGSADAGSVGGDITVSDLKTCERIVREDLADDYATCSAYTSELRNLLRWAYSTTDEFDISLYNTDHRYKTQDGQPDVLAVGPPTASGSEIKVPVKMRWPGYPAYVVTWILERYGNTWLIRDLFTTDHDNHNGSLLAWLRSL